MKAAQEHLEFLDGLRESGVTNMFGARPYLVAEFGLSKSDASAVLSEWMKTFSERKRTETPELVWGQVDRKTFVEKFHEMNPPRTPQQEEELEIMKSRGDL